MITVYKYTPKSKKEGYVRVHSRLEFFKQEYLIMKQTETQLIFIRPSISYQGKVYKTQKGHTSQFQSNIPPGTYEIDEESNEDKIIINFNEK